MTEPASTAARSESAPGGRPPREIGVRLPAAALSLLSGRCGELGSGSVAALRDAGRTAGRELLAAMSGEGEPSGWPVGRFWAELRGAAEERGLGLADYEVLAPDVARVDLRGSPEASRPSADGPRPRPGCHFAAGWLGGALTAVAGEPVAVLEVDCAAGGEEAACRFLLGPEARLREVRVALRGGASLAEALESG